MVYAAILQISAVATLLPAHIEAVNGKSRQQ